MRQLKSGIIRIPHQLSQCQAIVHQLPDDFLIIIFIAFITCAHIGPIHLFTQGTRIGITHEGNVARRIQGKQPTFFSFLFSQMSRRFTNTFRQTGNIFLVGQQHLKPVLIFQRILIELQRQQTQFGCQSAVFLFIFCTQCSSAFLEGTIGFIQQTAIFHRQIQRLTLIINRFYTGKQLFVQINIIRTFCQIGRNPL